jgi:hypothetical protein
MADDANGLTFEKLPLTDEGVPEKLPPVSFSIRQFTPFQAMIRDFQVVSTELQTHFTSGPLPFFVYATALFILLISLSMFLNMGAWPMANLFFGAVLFRLALAFESLFHRNNIDGLLGELCGIPKEYMSALVIGGLGIIFGIYSILLNTARGGSDAE